MQPENQLHVEMLIQSLQLLAAPYEQQIKAFPHFVDVPDEIALTFDDVYTFADALVRESLLTSEQKDAVEQLNTYLDQLSDKKDQWTLSALQTSSQWNRVRDMASNTLALIHVPKKAPNLFWIQYLAQKGDADKLANAQVEHHVRDSRAKLDNL